MRSNTGGINMDFIEQDINGVYLIQLKSQQDHRGFFMRTLDRDIWKQRGLTTDWVQENHSRSELKGTIRGLHYQRPPFAETKLIRVIRGEIMDVFVDLRKNSSTYGKCKAIELQENRHELLYLPKGVAHGFCSLVDGSELLYKVDVPYSPKYESGIRWDDPDLKISWPVTDPIMSEKDKILPLFSEFKLNHSFQTQIWE